MVGNVWELWGMVGNDGEWMLLEGNGWIIVGNDGEWWGIVRNGGEQCVLA